MTGFPVDQGKSQFCGLFSRSPISVQVLLESLMGQEGLDYLVHLCEVPSPPWPAHPHPIVHIDRIQENALAEAGRENGTLKVEEGAVKDVQ